jgi:hypothetical protein
MSINDDKDGDDNNMEKMTTQIEQKIQNFQQIFYAKNVCVPWWETLART